MRAGPNSTQCIVFLLYSVKWDSCSSLDGEKSNFIIIAGRIRPFKLQVTLLIIKNWATGGGWLDRSKGLTSAALLGASYSLRRIDYRSDHSQGNVSWFGIWVMASSCHSLLVCGIRLSLFLLPLVGIMALVCPIRLGHILNVPVGSMRPCGLFVKVQGCLPKRLFMPLTPIPDCLPAICPHSCHFSQKRLTARTGAVRRSLWLVK